MNGGIIVNEERKRILKMVEEGILSAEEAVILLDALDKSKDEQKEGMHEKQAPTSLSKHVDWESQDEYTKQTSYKQNSAKNKFTDFIDAAIKKIKDLDLDFNFGTSFEVQHIFQHQDVTLSSLNIDIANGDFTIEPWQENDVRIECNAKVYQVKDQESARSTFLHGVNFSVVDEKLHFSIEKKQMKVHTHFYVPQADYDMLKIRLFNGHIFGTRLNVNEWFAKTANGNIQMKSCKANEIELETANGRISVNQASANNLEAETLNGIIEVFGSFERTDLQSFNGNLRCTYLDDSCHTAFFQTKTGSIDVTIPRNVSIDGELKTNLGGFQCELNKLQILKEKKEVVQKEMKFFSNEGNEHKLMLEAESMTGSIHLKNN